ncbi:MULTISPECIES: UDP-N-acetylglucosamine 2-epimerase [unclassified Sphingobacterium]|uniref:UDP-N-acetylglucosamine 2-epimerase n=1 Tax=unclassified Sphingobacterium TaxID=2609468 RepID=UPI00104A8807|nr:MULTISPECIES: UDP-N-acetylglucosamine 2-epimerase [unclassified Sphingobacterium]MCS3555836.1 UDP-hydrolyzing UDP-N-acetyl-D-glucosamine 2-epimerase [Sphingobacterium sp. JUb21]TCR00711.1 UDP-N-acetylglucosamine 2-epimerase (non-hydrolysing)/GDP/UDP-N,N'-diacetylbacillosamine 2-epimerase (hydrolysing) [Sphingobacterium sp. JUb20]
MKKICIVTGTRAEYGLLKPLMHKLQENDQFELQIVATGAHLSPEFGLTYQFIESDGFKINDKVEMLLSSDTPTGIVKSMGLAQIGFADIFNRLLPNAIIILGDRYEMLSVASAATIFTIPIIHLHGGEITEGAYDDAIRHAISKLSSIHFTSTEEYRQRLIQMGELPNQVYNVGAIGLDNIVDLPLMSREELENSLGIGFKKYNYQITFHPETLSDISSEEQFNILLKAIRQQKDSYFIFTKANADTNGRIINQMIDQFVAENNTISSAYSSLGSLRFLSAVKICDAIVGNSSSGIIEAPSLGTATINIGDRQRGRTQATSVVNCKVDLEEILEAFQKISDSAFKKSLKNIHNPYGQGGTSDKVLQALSQLDFQDLKIKKFHNIAF